MVKREQVEEEIHLAQRVSEREAEERRRVEKERQEREEKGLQEAFKA